MLMLWRGLCGTCLCVGCRKPLTDKGYEPTFIISNNFTLGLSGKNLKLIMKKLLFRSVLLLMMSVTFFNCSSDSDSSTTNPVPCPQGYTGTNCATQITPSKIKITKIRVTSFPNSKPSGFAWDALPPGFSNPDIIPVLSSNSGTTILFLGTEISDAVSNGNDIFDFIPTTPIIINSPLSQYGLTLYDKDDVSPTLEFMGGWDFLIYNSTNNFPTVLHVGTGSNNVKFDLYLTYEW